jgi:hypothetical protein
MLKCPECGSEHVQCVDVGFDAVTGEASVTGDTLQCTDCLHYFSSHRVYAAYTMFGRWLPPEDDNYQMDKQR